MKDVKFCKICNAILGTRQAMGVHRFNAIQYCKNCAKVVTKQNKADYQREYRKDNRKYRKLMKERIMILEADNALLKELYQAKTKELMNLQNK